MRERDDTFELWDLRVEIVGDQERMVCDHRIGDYVGAIVLIALPALIAEFLVGRRGGASVVKTMDLLAQRDRIAPAWRYYGIMAALTSAITILETVVAAVEDYSGMPRGRIVLIVGFLLWAVGLGTVFSFNVLRDFYPLGFLPAFDQRTIFETLDYVVSNFMMPAGGMLIAMLAGWGLASSTTAEELAPFDGIWLQVWRALVRYIVPLAIAMVFVSNL